METKTAIKATAPVAVKTFIEPANSKTNIEIMNTKNVEEGPISVVAGRLLCVASNLNQMNNLDKQPPAQSNTAEIIDDKDRPPPPRRSFATEGGPLTKSNPKLSVTIARPHTSDIDSDGEESDDLSSKLRPKQGATGFQSKTQATTAHPFQIQ